MAKDVTEITEALEKGVADLFSSGRYQEYLDTMARFHDYSVNNIILIMMQNPDATLVAGYKAWQTKFKRHVKAGEKGLTILAPVPHKFIREVELEDGTKERKEIRYNTYRTCTVFDVSQTEGEPLPALSKTLIGSVDGFRPLLDKLTELSPVPVSFEAVHGAEKGHYSHVEKCIVVREGMSEAQTIKTLVHEITHAKLHDRDTGPLKDADRETKEVQAESVAYTVCNALGLDTGDYSFGYIAGWSKGREAKELQASLEIIRKTATEIIGELRAA